MLRKLPPLSALRLFEAAGRRGGFTAAAEELGVTPSAVSHAVRTLEDRLGFALFRRDARGLALTEAGQALLAESTRALEGLSRVVERLTAERATQGLRLSAGPVFASRWLLPRLAALRRRQPRLLLSITTETHWVEMEEGGCDLAIRVAREPFGSGEWFHLAQESLVPVVAPAYAGLTLAQALARLPALHVTVVRQDWPAWAAARGVEPPDPARGLRFDLAHLALEAAVQGAGVVLARLPVCAGDLAEGRLVPLDTVMPSGNAYWLVARPGLLRQTEGRQFANWLRQELSEIPSAAAE
jgi:DNA-binding transcriptional LysR family regulator